MQMNFTRQISACWLGKAIGGTLGGPWEGRRGPLPLAFYDPVPTSLLPNDDLDLQVVWLRHLLDTKAQDVTADTLRAAWLNHVGFPYDEYGVCLRNAAYGMTGVPMGSFDNWFSECMGAAIRSELWACLAPGEPERAAAFAWCDAACDHAAEGIWSEIFFAALESAAFVEKDRERLLDLALDFLPSTSRVRQAVVATRVGWKQSGDWRKVRTQIDEAFGQDNFTDVAQNIAYTVLGWLDGNGDFGKSILTAANCGADTDCTAATLGSLLGILAPDSIPAKWSAPIGQQIILSKEIMLPSAPRTLDELTQQTLQLSEQLRHAEPVMGKILPRARETLETSRLRIDTGISWSDDLTLLDGARSVDAAKLSFQPETLPGHWLRHSSNDFKGAVQLMKFAFTLETEIPLRISAWSVSPTAAWVDGAPLTASQRDWASVDCKHGGPSFHRGGPGNFRTPKSLTAGTHELMLAWKRPAAGQSEDLVIGLGDDATKQWLPYGLARQA